MPRPSAARRSLPGHSKAPRAKPVVEEDVAMEMESVQTVTEPQEEPPTVEDEAVRPPSKMKKSDKAYAKQQALLEKITAGANPYSKSHTRRMKRAARPSENLVTGLSEVENVLQEVTAQAEEEAEEEKAEQTKAMTGGKGQPKLTAKKRQHVLTTESTRLPAVLANPAFAANPFATIRQHTLNNLALIKKQAAERKAKGKGAKGGK